MAKYVFVTGGVVSGLGKGITAASLGRLLKDVYKRQVRNGVAELGLVLAVKDERNAEFGRHLRGELLLAEDERLEWVEEVFRGKTRQKTVRQAAGRAQIVVKTGVDPRLEVLPSPLGVDAVSYTHLFFMISIVSWL